jgi:hypothetical protein
MSLPPVCTGIEERGQPAAFGIERAQIGSFEGVAVWACQRQVLCDRLATRLLSDVMLDFEGEK